MFDLNVFYLACTLIFIFIIVSLWNTFYLNDLFQFVFFLYYSFILIEINLL